MMTDKAARDLLSSLNSWASEKMARGEGWPPGQFRELVKFLGEPIRREQPEST